MGTLFFTLTAVPFAGTTTKIPQELVSWYLPAGIIVLLFLCYLLLNIDKTKKF